MDSEQQLTKDDDNDSIKSNNFFNIPPRWPFLYLDQYLKPECPFISKRYSMATLAFIGFTLSFATHHNNSISKVIVKYEQINENATEEEAEMAERAMDHGFFWSYLASQIPGGLLVTMFPSNQIFGNALFISLLLNLIFPIAIYTNPILLVFIHIAQGFSEGIAVPAIVNMLRLWAPVRERSRMMCFIFSSPYFGFFIGSGIALLLSQSYLQNWPVLCYLYGVFGILWWFFWSWLTFESPRDHPTISSQELHYIEEFSDSNSRKPIKLTEIPWRKMLSARCVQVIILANFCRSLNYFMGLVFRTYDSNAVLYHHGSGEFFEIIPYGAIFLIVIVSGVLADILMNRKILTVGYCRKFFTCGGFFLELAPIIIESIIGGVSSIYTFIIMAICVCLGSMSQAGFNVNCLDIAPRYAAIIMAISNTIGLLGGSISQRIYSKLMTELPYRFEIIIWIVIVSVVLSAGILFYGLYASGEIQSWAEAPVEDETPKSYFERKYIKELQRNSFVKLCFWCIFLTIAIFLLTDCFGL